MISLKFRGVYTMSINKLDPNTLRKIQGGEIRKVTFIGEDLTIDPRITICPIGKIVHDGYAVYDDTDDTYICGFIGPESYKKALDFSVEKGLKI